MARLPPSFALFSLALPLSLFSCLSLFLFPSPIFPHGHGQLILFYLPSLTLFFHNKALKSWAVSFHLDPPCCAGAMGQASQNFQLPDQIKAKSSPQVPRPTLQYFLKTILEFFHAIFSYVSILKQIPMDCFYGTRIVSHQFQVTGNPCMAALVFCLSH